MNYIAKGLDASGPDAVVAIAIPIIAVVVIGVAQLLRRRILAAHRAPPSA